MGGTTILPNRKIPHRAKYMVFTHSEAEWSTATYYKGKLYARSGVPFEGLEHITNGFAWDKENLFVFDGELLLSDKGSLNDNEAFRTATGIINSDGDKTSICYTIFDVPYKCKRHNGILKVKRFYTMDLPIIGYEEGAGRLAGTLGAFILDYKGNEVRVGSGFTDEQRATFWDKKDSLIGILCEVKYKEISSDKNTGADSLQFPVFISLRTDKTNVSFV